MEVTYIDHMGSDLTVVNAARVSFATESRELEERDEKLIKYLAKHNHWTPFAHPQVTFRVKAPIFVRTQCFKHKVGFVENEISRRYVDFEPTFFIPSVWRGKPQNKKQGSSGTINYDNSSYVNFTKLSINLYQNMLDEGIAPEMARMVLPQSMYTEWYWTGSLSAWARFCNLRMSPDAQEEIKFLAIEISVEMAELFPISWVVLTNNTT